MQLNRQCQVCGGCAAEDGVIELPVGSRFHPLSAEQYEQAVADKCAAECDERNADKAVVSGMACDDTGRVEVGELHQLRLQRVVDPLAKADEEASSGYRRCRCGWESLEQPHAAQQKNRGKNDHYCVVPVINAQLCKWVGAFHKALAHLRRWWN